MIFYFSGTGNSLHAAEVIATAQKESLISIPEVLEKGGPSLCFDFKASDMLGLVYPVHAWGPPKMVMEFIQRLQISGAEPYIFSLCTCGEEEGHTTRMIKKALGSVGLSLDSGFTLVMPNNYMVGFKLDSEEIVSKKLDLADIRLNDICEVLKVRQAGQFQIISGRFPNLKSLCVNPLFKRFAMGTRNFYATEACTRCGLCAAICPIHTITVKDQPVWDKTCTMCLACINRCPVQAIEYGRLTVGKGRYVHSDIKTVPILE